MKFVLKDILKKYLRTVGGWTDIDEIATVALVLQRIFGQQILDPQWSWKKYYSHQIFNLCIFVYVFFGTFKVLKTTDDAEVIAEACYTLIMIVIFPLKMALYINNRNIFRKIYIIAKTTVMETITRDSEKIAMRVLKIGSRTVSVLFVVVLIPISIYEITTLWNYINGNRTLLSRSTMTLLPMTSPFYEFAWILHTVFLFEVSSTIILDMWFVLLIYFLCKASDSLIKTLAIIQRQNRESRSSYSQRLNEALKRFHTTHVKLNEYLMELRKMYKWLAFVPLCNATMCTCLILLLMSKEVNWRFAPHMLPMFAEIFTYNWFGEQIKTKATEMNMAMINFDWTGLSLRDRRSYLIILTFLQNECSIKTAVGNDLSLITMTAVLKVTYQAFTVLRTLDK